MLPAAFVGSSEFQSDLLPKKGINSSPLPPAGLFCPSLCHCWWLHPSRGPCAGRSWWKLMEKFEGKVGMREWERNRGRKVIPRGARLGEQMSPW